MSVSSIFARTCISDRSAILNSVVPPDTLEVAEAMICPGSIVRARTVPAIGARMVTSCRRSRASCRFVSARTNAARARGRRVDRRLVLLLSDDARGPQRLHARALSIHRLQPHLGGLQVRHGLRQRVLHVPRIDLRQQRALLHPVARLDEHAEHLAGGLRLHLHHADGLQQARGLGHHLEAPALGDGRGQLALGPRLLRAAPQIKERRSGESEHPTMTTTFFILPPTTSGWPPYAGFAMSRSITPSLR